MLTTKNTLRKLLGFGRCQLCEVIMDIEKALDEARITAIEAMFELDPFDQVTQKAFDDAIENS